MVEIALSGAKGAGRHALVDDGDASRALTLPWNLDKDGYAYCHPPGSGHSGGRLLMHRFILSAAVGDEVDHRNGDGLDNRRGNLRHCTHRENLRNQRPQVGTSSGFKGVWWHRAGQKWAAGICVTGKRLHLGLFIDERAAARAYDAAALEHFGEFARPNFPKEATA